MQTNWHSSRNNDVNAAELAWMLILVCSPKADFGKVILSWVESTGLILVVSKTSDLRGTSKQRGFCSPISQEQVQFPELWKTENHDP